MGTTREHPEGPGGADVRSPAGPRTPSDTGAHATAGGAPAVLRTTPGDDGAPPAPASGCLVLARYGEIALKGGNRAVFERALLRQVRRRLPPGARLSLRAGRIAVEAPGEPAAVLDALGHVFGLVGFHAARRAPADADAMAAVAVDLAREAVSAGAASFKIEARRADKRFALGSLEINRRLGAAVVSATGLRVDVHRPDLVIHVEVRQEGCFLYGPVTPGPGGLPVGTAGRGLLLLSGGIDSPVAGYLAMKRGLRLSAVYFHAPPYTGEKAREKVVDLCRLLARWGGPVRLLVVPFTEAQLAVRELVPDAYGTVAARRLMVRVADALSRREHAGALITGESLGQVASQTLESLTAIGEVTGLPLLRPLIGFDKAEIVARARTIGTYEVSVRPYEDCCSLFVPVHPKTRPTREGARAAEARLDVAGLVERAAAGTERLEVDEDGVSAEAR